MIRAPKSAVESLASGDPQPLIEWASALVAKCDRNARREPKAILSRAKAVARTGRIGRKTQRWIALQLESADDRMARLSRIADREDSREQKITQILCELHEAAIAHGWEQTFSSPSGSRYYERDGETLRIADHLVPQTGERDDAYIRRGWRGAWDREIIVDGRWPSDALAASVE